MVHLEKGLGAYFGVGDLDSNVMSYDKRFVSKYVNAKSTNPESYDMF